jgi:putative phosphoesterase
MKVCIVSDSHDRAPALAAAVARAGAEGAAAVIHCGDLIGAHTLKPLLELGFPVHFVDGNNHGDPLAIWKLCGASGGLLTFHGNDADLDLGGRRVFATHYPHYGYGMACTGDYDLVCCGHSHRASVTAQANIRGGRTWLVNPGTIAGLAAPPTWILADLDALTFDIRRQD